jgi:hypothetical protein
VSRWCTAGARTQYVPRYSSAVVTLWLHAAHTIASCALTRCATRHPRNAGNLSAAAQEAAGEARGQCGAGRPRGRAALSGGAL